MCFLLLCPSSGVSQLEFAPLSEFPSFKCAVDGVTISFLGIVNVLMFVSVARRVASKRVCIWVSRNVLQHYVGYVKSGSQSK
jgi:hypothetical protein